MYIVESGQAETCLTRELVLENAAWLAGHEGRAPLRRLEARLLAAKGLRILTVLKFQAILLVLGPKSFYYWGTLTHVNLVTNWMNVFCVW